MRRAIAVAVLGATLAGCGGGGQRTDLQVEFTSDRSQPVEYTVRCDPPSGTSVHPGQACAALAAAPRRYFGARGVGWCTGAMATWSPSYRVHVTGPWHGKAIDQRYTCSQVGLTRWAQLVGYRLIVVHMTATPPGP
jgi:hypothetical protein